MASSARGAFPEWEIRPLGRELVSRSRSLQNGFTIWDHSLDVVDYKPEVVGIILQARRQAAEPGYRPALSACPSAHLRPPETFSFAAVVSHAFEQTSARLGSFMLRAVANNPKSCSQCHFCNLYRVGKEMPLHPCVCIVLMTYGMDKVFRGDDKVVRRRKNSPFR